MTTLKTIAADREYYREGPRHHHSLHWLALVAITTAFVCVPLLWLWLTW